MASSSVPEDASLVNPHCNEHQRLTFGCDKCRRYVKGLEAFEAIRDRDRRWRDGGGGGRGNASQAARDRRFFLSLMGIG